MKIKRNTIRDVATPPEGKIRSDDLMYWNTMMREVHNGEPGHLFAKLYKDHASYLENYARTLLYHRASLEDFMQKYWLSLVEKRSPVKYEGRCSLRTFLTGILRFKLFTWNKKYANERERSIGMDGGPWAASGDGKDSGSEWSMQNVYPGNNPSGTDEARIVPQGGTPEAVLLAEERRQFVRECLQKIREKSAEDAYLINMKLNDENMTNYRLAKIWFIHNRRPLEESALAKEEERIKKKFQRYRVVVEEYLAARKIYIGDLRL